MKQPILRLSETFFIKSDISFPPLP